MSEKPFVEEIHNAIAEANGMSEEEAFQQEPQVEGVSEENLEALGEENVSSEDVQIEDGESAEPFVVQLPPDAPEWKRQVVEQLLKGDAVDLTQIPSFRKAQASYERKIKELQAQLRKFQIEKEREERQRRLREKLQQARTKEEAARIVEEELMQQYEQEARQVELEAEVEKLRQWDEYYVNTLNVPPQVLTQITEALSAQFEQKYPEPSVEALVEFHNARDAAIRAWLAAQQQQRQQRAQAPAPQPQKPQTTNQAPQERPRPKTVAPRQGALAEPNPLDLFANEDWEALKRLTRR